MASHHKIFFQLQRLQPGKGLLKVIFAVERRDGRPLLAPCPAKDRS